jgi:uncharacterized membrane protein
MMAALPLFITLAVTAWLVGFVVDYAGPQSRFGRFLISLGLGFNASSVPPYLLGLAVVVAGIYVLGLLVESRLGGWVSTLVDRMVRPIPGVSSVYDLSKRVTSIVDFKGDDSLASMSAVWCFFGGAPGAAVLALLPSSKPVLIGKDEYLGILVPSAPVPVGGALIYVPTAWIKPAEGGVERVMSVYVSMGVTPPLNTQA